jgi:hypothetical protein
MYCSMFGTLLKSLIMMHPNPTCRIIVICQMRPFGVIIDAHLLALSKTHDVFLGVNRGWRLFFHNQ